MLRIPLTELPGAIPHSTGEQLIELAEQASGGGDLRVELGGQVIANAQEGEISSEMVGLAIAALVLLLTFGSIVAAGLPLATALFGLGVSSALIGLLAAVMDVPDWAPALASMLGHRRRDRLRAADRDALPVGARRRARRARGGRRVGRHRRALRADRRHDRGHLAARACC